MVCRSTQGPPPRQYQMPSCSGLVSGFRPLHNILQSHCRSFREKPDILNPKPVMAILQNEARYIDDNHVLHPFFHHRLDVGPIRLTSIAHAFNYRIAVLRDGVKPAARVGHSWRAARQILENVDIPWSHQVAVMLQIVSMLAFEVPEVLLELGQLKVKLSCEPWGHTNHQGGDCECLSSDRTGAYVHELALATSFAGLNLSSQGAAGYGFYRPVRSAMGSLPGFSRKWRNYTLSNHATWLSAICVPLPRSL